MCLVQRKACLHCIDTVSKKFHRLHFMHPNFPLLGSISWTWTCMFQDILRITQNKVGSQHYRRACLHRIFGFQSLFTPLVAANFCQTGIPQSQPQSCPASRQLCIFWHCASSFFPHNPPERKEDQMAGTTRCHTLFVV